MGEDTDGAGGDCLFDLVGVMAPSEVMRAKIEREKDSIYEMAWRGMFTRDIARELGISRGTVFRRIDSLRRDGRAVPRTCRPWTAEEEAELRGLWGWKDVAEVAEELMRTPEACYVRAKKLKLSMAWRGAYSASATGRIFGVSPRTVLRWIAHKWIRATLSRVGAGVRRQWRIEHEAIEAFIAAYPLQYERRRITDEFWRRLADRAAAPVSDLVSLEVAARIVGRSHDLVRYWVHRGCLPGVKDPFKGSAGFRWMVPRSALALLCANTQR